MKIDSAKYFQYTASEINQFFAYSYEWIDMLDFTIQVNSEIKELDEFIHAAKEKFLAFGWEGTGEIGLIWIPPFVLSTILKGGAEAFLQKFGAEIWESPGTLAKNSCTKGLLLWHVKQVEDGTSFILSPIELDISSYVLY